MRSIKVITAAAVVAAIGSHAFAQSNGTNLGPTEFESDRFSLDRSSNTMIYDGFRMSAEGWSITANHAIASADDLDFQSGQWRFEDNVVFNLNSANLRANEIIIEFRDKRIVTAKLVGAPVEFEDHVAPEDGPVFGSAEELIFNNDLQTIELVGKVSLTVGPYHTTGCDLVYYLGEEEFTTGSRVCDEPFRTVIEPRQNSDDDNSANSQSPDSASP